MTALCSPEMWDGDVTIPRIPWDRKLAVDGPGRPLKVRRHDRSCRELASPSSFHALSLSHVLSRSPFTSTCCSVGLVFALPLRLATYHSFLSIFRAAPPLTCLHRDACHGFWHLPRCVCVAYVA